MKMTIEIDKAIYDRLHKIGELHKKVGALSPKDRIEVMVNHVLEIVYDGFDKPNSWQGRLTKKTGLMIDEK